MAITKNTGAASGRKEIPFGRPWIDDTDRNAVMEVLHGHVLTHGPKCKEFEEVFAKFIGGGTAVSTSSCMASLHLSTMRLGVGPGDEVIVPSQTHVATVHAVELVGAKPVFVDCAVETGNIDLKKLTEKITSKTKAIVLVHFAGIPVDMERVCAIAAANNLKVIEDCALTVGGYVRGKHVGLWGDTGCFSFYPVKHMTTAEGGMLTAKDPAVAKDIAHFRAFSVDRTFNERKVPGVYDVTGVGLNYRMSELQAALGCTQVAKLPENLRRRKENFATLKTEMTGIKGISHVLDSTDPQLTNSHYCLVAILDPAIRARRNELLLALTERGIGCSVYYPQPVPRMKYYLDKYKTNPQDFATAAVVSDGSIALPVGPHLSVQDMHLIAEGFSEILGELR